MLDKVASSIVTDFPWQASVGDPETKEQHAYASGILIQRLRTFFNDDSHTELINWGAGPTNRSVDISKIKVGQDTGTFGVFVTVVPEDLDLYRALLPINFTMPERPLLSLVNLDYNQPNPITRYREGMVMLSATGADGTPTWYVHSMPVESWLMLMMGHDWGFRKSLFDMTISREATTVKERSGELYMSLELTKESWTDDAIVPDGRTGGINNMSVVYPRNPEMVLRFASNGQTRVLEDEKSMVRITVGEHVDWAGLLPDDAVAPGFYQRFISGGGDASITKVS